MGNELIPKSQTPEWLVVYSTHNLNEAYIVAGRLKVEGIQSLVHRQVGAGALGITIGALGEVQVLVKPADYDHALNILDPDDPDMLPDNTDDIHYTFPKDDDEPDLD
jgi:hypothetical protein